jgi:diguanylate cyclase (GGDEF)-like protein/PAS domain S-box-containing protein
VPNRAWCAVGTNCTNALQTTLTSREGSMRWKMRPDGGWVPVSGPVAVQFNQVVSEGICSTERIAIEMTTSEFPNQAPTTPIAPISIDTPFAEPPMRQVLIESTLDLDRALYLEVLDDIEDGVYLVDRSERIQWWNRGAEKITGFARDEVVGRTCSDNLLCHVDASGRFLCTNGCPLRRAFVTGIPIETDAYLHHKAGHRLPVHIKTKPIRDRHGQVVGAVEVFRRASEAESQARLIEELSQLALIDELTRLPNRRLFDIQLDRRLAELDRYGWPFGVLMIDIDHFKQVNDDFGHQLGDDILRLDARTLSANCRSLDTIVRLGGDEFAAIIANVHNVDLHKLAEKLRSMIEMSGLRNSARERHRTTVSIGCAMARQSESATLLLKRADDMLYAAKKAGRNRVCF